MRAIQIVIKAFALCLAGVIIVTIIASVLGAVSLVGMLAGADENSPGEMSTLWQNDAEEKVVNLDVKIGATTLYLYESQEDKTVRVETNNEHIESWKDGESLYVLEKSHLYLSNLFSDGDLVIYVPTGTKFVNVKIEAGAGTLKIKKLTTENLDLDLGAGKTSIEYLKVSGKARINGGAGLTEIEGGDLSNLQLELGAGKAEVKAKLRGNNDIHSGVGKLDLDLIGRESDYKILIDKGIGSVTVNGEKQEDDAIYGSGKELVKVESGVGAVEIRIVAE